jgi:threonine/homoserine/homoserine lactone efflux protein
MFAGIMVLGQFSPGPDMILLTRTSLREGSGVGVRMASGIACGLAVHATVAVAGVAVALQRIPSLRLAMQWLAALYLLWLARGMLGEAFSATNDGTESTGRSRVSRHSPFVRGLLCNLLNPKAALFLAAVCAPFLVGERPGWWPHALWGLIVGLGLGLWSLWALVLQWRPLRLAYEKSTRWIDGLFGLVLAALALRLLVG